MNACDALFESLSAWIDGEAAPAEAARVQEHLAGCPECREAERAMRDLQGLAEPALPVPADFVDRTVQGVLQRAERSPWMRLQRLARAFDRGLPLPSLGGHPLEALLGPRTARGGQRGPAFWFGLALLAYALPAVALAVLNQPASGRFFLVAAGLGLLVVLPWYHFRADVSLLTTLRRSRCLEEILGTGLPAAGVSDALARFSLGSLWRAGGPVALVLLAGTVLFPAADRGAAMAAAALWLPITSGMLLAGSYAMQALVNVSRGPASTALGSAVVLGPAGLLLASAAWLAGSDLFGGAVAAVVEAGLWLGLAGRAVAIWAMDNASRLDLWKPSARRRNRWMSPWSDNPVVVRETRRAAGRVPGGPAGLLVARLLPLAVPAVGAWLLLDLEPREWPAALWLGLLALALSLFVRAAMRTGPALAQEREQGTLEALVQSGLSSAEFSRGWLLVACGSLWLEVAALGGLLLLGSLVPSLGGEAFAAGRLALAVVALAAMPLAGAWTGLALSARFSSRRDVGGAVVGATVKVAGLFLLAWGAAAVTLALAALGLKAEFEPHLLVEINEGVLPAAALGLVAAALAWKAGRDALRSMDEAWAGRDLRLPAREPLRRSLLLLPALAATVLAGLHLGVLAGGASGSLAVGACTAAIFSALAVWLARPILARAAEGPAALVVVMTGGAGAACGALLGSVPMLAGALARLGLGDSEPVALAAGLGLVLGAAWGGLGSLAGAGEPPALEWPLLGRRAAPALAGLVLLLGGSALAAAAFLDVPLDSEALQATLGEVERREAAREAVPAERDGFALMAPMLMAGANDPIPSRMRHLADQLGALKFAAVGDREEILQALRGSDEAERAAADFDRALPFLRQVLARPEFVARPRLREGVQARVPNFILVRSISQGLRVRALMLEQEGRAEEALDLHLLNLDWSGRMAGQGPLIHGMITVAMTSSAQEGLQDFLARHPLDEVGYARVKEALASSPVTMDAFRRNLEEELAFGTQAFRDLESGRMADLDMASMGWLPRLYVQRERRVYQREFQGLARAALAARPAELLALGRPQEEEPGLGLSRVLLPRLDRAILQARLAVTRRAALMAVCDLEAWRLRHGSYPAALSEGVDLLTPGGRLPYRRVGDGYRLWSSSPLLRVLKPEEGTEAVWMERVSPPGR